MNPEGREYRRRADVAEKSNQPLIRECYETGLNGEWKSLATVTLEIMDKLLPAEEITVAKTLEIVSTKRQRKDKR